MKIIIEIKKEVTCELLNLKMIELSFKFVPLWVKVWSSEVRMNKSIESFIGSSNILSK